MFKVGDLVVYGNTGVCTVDSIGPSVLKGADQSKIYYYLSPYYSVKCRIMIPCDNDKVVIRKIISKEEAVELINDFDNIGYLEVPDEKSREQIYKNTVRGCDCREIFGMIKTIYERKQSRLAEGKKVTSNDEKYYIIAEEKLYGELAVVLGRDRSEIRDYINLKISSAYQV